MKMLILFLISALFLFSTVNCYKYFNNEFEGYTSKKTDHTIIFYEDDLSSLIEEKYGMDSFLQMHEEAYIETKKALNNSYNSTIAYFIKTQFETEPFQDKSGFADFSNNRITCIFMNDYNDFLHLLIHETVHLVSLATFGTPSLQFFMEGIAVALSGSDTGENTYSSSNTLKEISYYQLITILKYERFAFYDQDKGLNYAVSGSFCKFLIENYGIEKFSVLFSYCTKYNWEAMFATIYDKPIDELYNEWQATIKE